MPDGEKNFGGSLVFEKRKWRHMTIASVFTGIQTAEVAIATITVFSLVRKRG